MSLIDFAPPAEDPALEGTRERIRSFLAETLADVPPRIRARSWSGFDAAFSRKLGRAGFIGMTWPKAFGGQEMSSLHRYVVLEELLAAGAPVAAHWFSDRQSGPLLLRFGSPAQRADILPRIAAGECYFCIGMSEPGSGSDLAAVRTRATAVDGGFRITGTKLWTTYAHEAHYMILLCRTGTAEERHGGLSQFLVPMGTPGITVNPIIDLAGEHHFNEVVLDDVHLPGEALIGKEGEGWQQVTSELALERSGPERFLSSMVLLVELIRQLRTCHVPGAEAAIGRLTAHLVVLRQLSRSVAAMLHRGENPAVAAAIVKDLGSVFEQEIPEIARLLGEATPDLNAAPEFDAVLAGLITSAPSFSLRGGTREILRGIIARGLGLR
ncbi:acyl-CoA dehydrogenase family protein [Xanthobacteraceae bacterium A53D]